MTTIKHMVSKTPGRVPTSSQILEGEIAINLPDKRLFTKHGSEVIELPLGGSGGNIQMKRVIPGGARTWFGEDASGKIWSWGRSYQYSMGQGSGSTGEGYYGFKMVPLPYDTHKVVDVFPIADTTYFILENSISNGLEIWACGRNDRNQCCNGNTTAVTLPTLIFTKVKEYWFPTNATVALSITFYFRREDSSTIYVGGTNQYGRSGDGTTAYIPRAKNIGMPSGYVFEDITDLWNIGAGYGRTFIKMKDNTLWGCGYNGQGQLGNGNTATQSRWSKVSASTSLVSKIRDIQGTSGWHNTSSESAYGATFILTTDGDVYSFGSNNYSSSGHAAGHTTVPTKLPINRSVSDLYIGCQAGHHFCTYEDGSVVMWGTDQQNLWNGAVQKIVEAGESIYWGDLWQGMDTAPNISFTPLGFYRGYFRQPIFWWPDGTYWHVSDDRWGSAGRGTNGAAIKWSTTSDLTRWVPIDDDDEVVQMEWLDSSHEPTIFAVTKKGQMFGVGHNGTNWNDMPSLYNQYKVATNSVWQRLI